MTGETPLARHGSRSDSSQHRPRLIRRAGPAVVPHSTSAVGPQTPKVRRRDVLISGPCDPVSYPDIRNCIFEMLGHPHLGTCRILVDDDAAGDALHAVARAPRVEGVVACGGYSHVVDFHGGPLLSWAGVRPIVIRPLARSRMVDRACFSSVAIWRSISRALAACARLTSATTATTAQAPSV